jgi:hypothetical protein
LLISASSVLLDSYGRRRPTSQKPAASPARGCCHMHTADCATCNSQAAGHQDGTVGSDGQERQHVHPLSCLSAAAAKHTQARQRTARAAFIAAGLMARRARTAASYADCHGRIALLRPARAVQEPHQMPAGWLQRAHEQGQQHPHACSCFTP